MKTNHLAKRYDLETLVKTKLASRIEKRELSLWPLSDGSERMLDWLDLPESLGELIDRCTELKKALIEEGINTVFVVGMGGSSGQARAIAPFLGGDMQIKVLDLIAPESITKILEEADIEKSVFLIASKSGSTTECLSLESYLRVIVSKKVSKASVANHFVCLADEGSGLAKRGKDPTQFRKYFPTEKGVGGRYSLLTAFGVLPAVLGGVDKLSFIKAVQSAKEDFLRDDDKNKALSLASSLFEAYRELKDKLSIGFSDARYLGVCYWLEQIVAESTGKSGLGVVPLVEKNLLGLSKQGQKALSSDRCFVFFGERSLAPSVEGGYLKVAKLKSIYDVIYEMFMWQVVVVMVSHLIGIDPFDQPNVELAKQKARLFTSGELDVKTESIELKKAFELVCQSPKPGDFVAICAFVPEDDKSRAFLRDMSESITKKTKMPTLASFGPRYLHSTGQLMKGGKNCVRVLILVPKKVEFDLQIPGKRFSFYDLMLAQAKGDLVSLKELSRKAFLSFMDFNFEFEK